MSRATAAVALVLAVAAGCGTHSAGTGRVVPGGSADVGRRVIAAKGCGSCHEIPGVKNANGLVGPPLTKFGRRGFIAGRLPNTPESLVRWVTDPRGVDPQTDMPDLGVTTDEARNIAAYLEGLG